MSKKSSTIVMIIITTLFIGVILGVLFSEHFSKTTVIYTGKSNFVINPTDAATIKIDINTATAEELSMLPGLGLELSERIIAYRQMHGPFLTVDDLTYVEGIGKNKLDSIREYITVGG